MTTIDDFNINIHNLYALRTRMVEQFDQQIHLQEASVIPPQTQLVDIFPKLSEIDLLIGVVPVLTPWAYFFPPKRFRFIRRSPFGFFSVAPTLGSLDDQEEEERKLEAAVCKNQEEEEEKEMLVGLFDQVRKINEWLSFIVGRMGQFLQG